MLGIGPLELVIVAFILLMLFGAKRLPEVGRSLGSGMREFKDSITGVDKDEDKEKPGIETASETDKVDSEVVTENKA